MEPTIQYAKTADGVSIAVWTLGEGQPLIGVPTGPWSMTMEWQVPGYRRWYNRLARSFMVVLYDNRGTGLSGSEEDWSFESQNIDLDAVADHLGLASFALIVPSMGGPAAIAYAAARPERVSQLILWCTWARTADALDAPQAKAILALIDKDWEVLTETMAHIICGWSAGSEAHEMAVALRNHAPQAMVRSYIDALLEFDVSHLLPEMRLPTMVVHCRQSAFPAINVAQGLAARIPGARFTVLEGSPVPWLDDMESKARALEDFLGMTDGGALATSGLSGLVTVLFTDIQGSTSLTQRLGDDRAQKLLRTHNRIVRDALAAHGGSEIKHTGDGIMAAFPLASSAVACAIDVQRAVAEQVIGGGESELRVRIGLNAGEPVAEDDDLFGTAVQLARRVCDSAEAGQVLASDVVRGLAAGKDFVFRDVGTVTLKGFDEPARVHQVIWTGGREVPAGAPGGLTPRESEVLGMLAGGWTAKEIAAHLSISLSTVQRHSANIYAKIGARGRVDAVAFALSRGIVRPRDG